METLRKKIRDARTLSQTEALESIVRHSPLPYELRQSITQCAVELVEKIRRLDNPGIMELFLAEYGLSTEEGVALMCLAEALLRVPDSNTIDALIEDKITPSEWGHHLGQSHSSLVNASTWALYFTGKVLDDASDNSVTSVLRGTLKRVGEPVIRQAVKRIMKELGGQFVLGENIESAIKRAATNETKGFTYSYDMLGEAAQTDADARRYHLAYTDAITNLAAASNSDDISSNPGISIKLSALHPRYETIKRQRAMDELVPRANTLAILAKSAGIGLNIDAEEAGRLDLSLDVIEAMLSNPALKGWNGFGVVVQAYSKRAPYVLHWLYELATKLDRQIMVRLVKGAYWDTEIKHAQVEGHTDYPVFIDKAATDISYICCAQQLLQMTDRIYPQFATHNAHTVAAILEMAKDKTAFEFQRLHGMGEALHDTVAEQYETRCRIYAPVGAHKDLLAYLVRRLLENGANSSFVNQIVDHRVAPEIVAADPFDQLNDLLAASNPRISAPVDLFQPERQNSTGWDLEDPATLDYIETMLRQYQDKTWSFTGGHGDVQTIKSPATGELTGEVHFATEANVEQACACVRSWDAVEASQRAKVLNRAADLYESHSIELFALLMKEAGKTILDCVGEVREAVDFLRYYASQAKQHTGKPAGVFTCISPWNFPLAIFTGQISAALAAGNGVLAKPAETTSLIAHLAVTLLKEAGVPDDALQLLPGTGSIVGRALVTQPSVNGVCFTGSTLTAQNINRDMAESLAPHAPLIAETGGINAMIVDSTALPEQAVADIVASAFQSAGQRCSALRMLYVQEDVAESFMTMLFGAMDELSVGDPQVLSTDIGPVIDVVAQKKIQTYIKRADTEGRLLKQIPVPDIGTYVAPTAVSVSGIEELAEEIFGPVLHVATFAIDDLERVIDKINATGYGLTFGLHSRIDDRVETVMNRIAVGNVYINRNQIGAVVGSQPFGGEGLSGTGPKAGGPHYLARFFDQQPIDGPLQNGSPVSAEDLESAFKNNSSTSAAPRLQNSLPGPTGESNQLTLVPKNYVLCLGPSAEQAELQARRAKVLGCNALAVAPGVSNGIDGTIDADTLKSVGTLDAVVFWSSDTRMVRVALANRSGALVPLLSMDKFEPWVQYERHVCIDTTAAGGNAALLAECSTSELTAKTVDGCEHLLAS